MIYQCPVTPDSPNKGRLYLGGVGSLKAHIVQKLQLRAVLSIMDSYMFTKLAVNDRVSKCEIDAHLHL